MPKAPLKAQIVVVLFAVLAIAWGLSIVRLDGGSGGSKAVLPGQLIVIRIDGASHAMTSSDSWVVAPVSITLSPTTRAYFVAVKPGRATLRAYLTCPECRGPLAFWSVDVTVRPG